MTSVCTFFNCYNLLIRTELEKLSLFIKGLVIFGAIFMLLSSFQFFVPFESICMDRGLHTQKYIKRWWFVYVIEALIVISESDVKDTWDKLQSIIGLRLRE